MKRTSLDERREQVRGKLAAGYRMPPLAMLRHDDSRRTPSKRALLARLKEIAAAHGRKDLL
jgi:hypothetical protein